MSTPYTIVDARYAKGKKIIRCPGDGTGLKTRAMRLAGSNAIHGKWVNRSHGYTVSPASAARFERLYAEGYDASPFTGALMAPLKD